MLNGRFCTINWIKYIRAEQRSFYLSFLLEMSPPSTLLTGVNALYIFALDQCISFESRFSAASCFSEACMTAFLLSLSVCPHSG